MERKVKDTPPRLPVVFQAYDPPLYLVTFNTLLRRPLLACDAVHHAFCEYSERGIAFHVATGRYVLMPDHVHVFVRIGRDMALRRWESGLKQRLGKTLAMLGHEPTEISGSKLKSFWQPGFFDRLLRHNESYAEKWDYVWPLPDHNQSIFLFATMEADPTKACNQDDATGFIRLNGWRLNGAADVQKT